MRAPKYFLNSENTDAVTTMCLRLKKQLMPLPFYAKQEAEIGDILWVNLASSWYGAVVTLKGLRAVVPKEYMTTTLDAPEIEDTPSTVAPAPQVEIEK